MPRCVATGQTRWTFIDSAVVISSRLVHDTAIVPGCSSILSLNCWRKASAGSLALSRTIVVRIRPLLLSVIWKFLNLSFLAAQENALWQIVLGDEMVNEVVILPMVFQIGLHEYSSWLFLYIVDSWVLRNSVRGQQLGPRPEMRHVLCPFERLKDARAKQVCLGYMFGMRIVKNQDVFWLQFILCLLGTDLVEMMDRWIGNQTLS